MFKSKQTVSLPNPPFKAIMNKFNKAFFLQVLSNLSKLKRKKKTPQSFNRSPFLDLRNWISLLSVRAVLTTCHRLGGLYRSLFSHCCGDQKSKIQVQAELVSSEASLSGLYTTGFSLGLHVVACRVLISSQQDTGHIGLGPAPKTSFNLNCLVKVLGLQHMNLGAAQFSP